jgi:hypothetical protein
MTSSEKRRAPRIQPFVTPCRVWHGVRHFPGYLADLSILGARVDCDAEPPLVGDAVVLDVRFGREVRHSRLPGEVKWVRIGRGEQDSNAFGLTFTSVTAEERQVLESVVAEFRRRAEELE